MDKSLLPGCMLPDGGQACKAYRQQSEQIQIMEVALRNISKHQAIVGGSLSKLSTTKLIADKALKDAGFSND